VSAYGLFCSFFFMLCLSRLDGAGIPWLLFVSYLA
jgi:hypothetical protein